MTSWPGQKIRVLTVVDTFSRFSPVIDPRFSYRAEDVVATLERICVATGYPKTIGVDQGSKFINRDLDLWTFAKGVTLDFSRPGKPTDNASIEAFNGRFRAECLNTHSFLILADAREKLEDAATAVRAMRAGCGGFYRKAGCKPGARYPPVAGLPRALCLANGPGGADRRPDRPPAADHGADRRRPCQ